MTKAAPHIQRKASRDYLERNREEINAKRRKRYAQLTPEQRRSKNGRNNQHQRAGNRLRYAVATGKIIKPDRCSQCGKVGRVEAHHKDYEKPLDVQWLCANCHGLTRRKRDALLAAAPELLAACKAALARGCSCQSTEDENWHAPGSVLAAACPIPMIKTAIAKAEGRDADT